ncbi:hypothetical protein ACWHA1_37690, partial [Streptomyces decoyicus]
MEASGLRGLAVGGDLGIGVTGDNNTVHQYLVFASDLRAGAASGHSPDQPPSVIRAVVPVLVGQVEWVGQSKSVHPGRRLVRAYT